MPSHKLIFRFPESIAICPRWIKGFRICRYVFFPNYDDILGKEIWINHLISIHFTVIPPVTIFLPNPPRKEAGEVGIESKY